MRFISLFFFFFFNDTATTEIYTLSLHDALPIYVTQTQDSCSSSSTPTFGSGSSNLSWRSEEHTSELQSQSNLVCRLLLEKKKENICKTHFHTTVILQYHMPSPAYT